MRRPKQGSHTNLTRGGPLWGCLERESAEVVVVVETSRGSGTIRLNNGVCLFPLAVFRAWPFWASGKARLRRWWSPITKSATQPGIKMDCARRVGFLFSPDVVVVYFVGSATIAVHDA